MGLGEPTVLHSSSAWWKDLSTKHRWLLFAIIVLASILRLTSIAELELWHDEAGSVLAANGLNYVGDIPPQGFTKADLPAWNTMPNVLRACLLIDGGNGSLYTVLLHGWTGLFGNSPVSVRWLSLLASLIALLVLFTLGRRLFDDVPTALWASGLVAVSQTFIGQAVQGRSYALAMLLSLLATALLFRMAGASRVTIGHIGLYALAVIAALLCHYSAVYVFLAHPFVALVMRVPWKNIWRMAVGGLIAIVLLGIWMQVAGNEGLEQMKVTNQKYVDMVAADPGVLSFFAATKPATLAEGWVVQLLAATGNGLRYAGPQLRVIMILLVFPFLLILHAIKRAQAAEQRILLALVILLLSSMCYATVLALISGHTVSFQPHYAGFAAPYAALLLGRSLAVVRTSAGIGRPILLASTGALVLIAVGSLALGRPTGITSPNRYALFVHRTDVALGRYSADHVHAVHGSRNAAYLFALYSSEQAAHLQNYVDTRYTDISGLVVERGDRNWLIPIRPHSDLFPRSEPRDPDILVLDHGLAPSLPDSTDAWATSFLINGADAPH